MLDLNVDAVFLVDSTSCHNDADLRNTAAADSVASTTTSTTNNAAADEVDCSSFTGKNSVSTLNFSILNKNVIEIEDDTNNDIANIRNELQLFPTGASPPSPSMVRAKYWLNLSAPEVSSGGPAELGICKAEVPANNQVQQPQVKKSRRGPRSRSSQYRGVTFYRRTGRWESHIWFVYTQTHIHGVI